MTNKVNAYELLEKIRKLLDLSIEDMCDQMNWPNKRYYNFIQSGRIQGKSTEKKPSSPTINKIFDGINYAIENYPHWKKHTSEITSITITELFKAGKNRS